MYGQLDVAILNFANDPKSKWIFHVELCLKKIKLVPMQGMQAHRENRGTAPLILTLGTRWGRVVNFMSRLL
jgi:hypothetical protein